MNCYIVKDLLPSYIDGLVGDETRKDILEHLDNCPECRLLYEQMNVPIEPKAVDSNRKEINFFKKVKAKTVRKVVLVAAALIIVFAALAWIFAIGSKADSEDVSVTTEIQHNSDAYLGKEWVVHFALTDGKALIARSEYEFTYDESGNMIPTGCTITLNEVQPSSLVMECNNFTYGYSYRQDEKPSSDYDYTVTVRFKDKETVYSMRDEGVFEAEK